VIYKFEKDGKADVISSSIPGMMLVPPGFNAEDAIPATVEEFKAHLDSAPIINTSQPSISDLQAQIDELKALITKQSQAQ
jgi:hypothetical protein